MTVQPLVSIITPTFNSARYFEDCLRSVANQKYGRIEHIVCDNCSTDRTGELAQRYEARLLVSPDRGLYEAINRGISACMGDIVACLNSDDAYHDNEVIADVVDAFRRHPGADVVYGHSLRTDSNWRPLYVHRAPARLSYEMARRRGFVISHQAVFCRTHLFRRFGGYDEAFKVSADCDLWLRFLREGIRFAYLDRIIGKFRLHGDNYSIRFKHRRELGQIRTRHGASSDFMALLLKLLDAPSHPGYIRYLAMRSIKQLVLSVRPARSLDRQH